MSISHSKICLNDINAYLLNADSKHESIIMFAFVTNNIKISYNIFVYI